MDSEQSTNGQQGLPHLHSETSSAKREASKAAARAVGAYLDFLKQQKTALSQTKLERQVRKLEAMKAKPDKNTLEELKLLQMQRDLEREREYQATVSQVAASVTQKFVDHAAYYADRFGIEYETWVDFGVPKQVLRSAGIKKTPQL